MTHTPCIQPSAPPDSAHCLFQQSFNTLFSNPPSSLHNILPELAIAFSQIHWRRWWPSSGIDWRVKVHRCKDSCIHPSDLLLFLGSEVFLLFFGTLCISLSLKGAGVGWLQKSRELLVLIWWCEGDITPDSLWIWCLATAARRLWTWSCERQVLNAWEWMAYDKVQSTYNKLLKAKSALTVVYHCYTARVWGNLKEQAEVSSGSFHLSLPDEMFFSFFNPAFSLPLTEKNSSCELRTLHTSAGVHTSSPIWLPSSTSRACRELSNSKKSSNIVDGGDGKSPPSMEHASGLATAGNSFALLGKDEVDDLTGPNVSVMVYWTGTYSWLRADWIFRWAGMELKTCPWERESLDGSTFVDDLKEPKLPVMVQGSGRKSWLGGGEGPWCLCRETSLNVFSRARTSSLAGREEKLRRPGPRSRSGDRSLRSWTCTTTWTSG